MSRESHPSESTDDALLARWTEHADELAFREILHRHGGLVERIARRRLTEPESAGEITGSAFALLARRPRRVPDGQLVGWLVKVTHHLVATENRSVLRRRHREQSAVPNLHETPMPPDPELLARIEARILALRPADRECVLMHTQEGLAYGEVGQRLGISEDAARMRIQRALEKVRRGLGLEAGGFLTALEGLKSDPLPTSQVDALLRRSLDRPMAGPPGLATGGIGLGWLLITQLQKTTLVLGALLLLLGAATGVARLADASTPSRPKPESSVEWEGFAGAWRGTLTYVVRRDGRRVTMPVRAELNPLGGGLRMRVRYADPNWAVDARLAFVEAGKILRYTDKGETAEYLVTSASPGRVTGTRSVNEPGRPRIDRMTLERTGDRLVYRIDEQLNRRPFVLASETVLERAR